MAKNKTTAWINLGLSFLVSAGLMYGLSNSLGPLPALGNVFNPYKGVWNTATKANQVPTSEKLSIPGLQKTVQIVYEADGTPHVKAETEHDAWVAIGYLHAKYRLFQMDITRRQGRGQLAEVVGQSALKSDEFQRQLNLGRTAEAEWQSIKPNSEEYDLLTAYAQGVNAVIDEENASDNLPLMFKMLGYKPKHWLPEDTLVLKGVLNQEMSFSDGPLKYAVLAGTLGYDRTMQLFPVIPTNQERPYSTTPRQKDPLEPMPISGEQYFADHKLEPQGAPVATATSTAISDTTSNTTSAAIAMTNSSSNHLPNTSSKTLTPSFIQTAAAAADVLDLLNNLPADAIRSDQHSNAWVVDGSKTASGKPLLAGDPHLNLTLPSIWYQIDVQAPGIQFAGVTTPGIPLPLIGHNPNLSFSMTDGQEQQTFYYKEKTDPTHPNQYLWKGTWHNFDTRTEAIPVKGVGTEHFTIKSTIHGPLVNQEGQTMAMDWLGTIPSNGVSDLLHVVKANNIGEFQNALADWRSPIMNFTAADAAGNIAVYSPGYYAVFDPSAKPWMPMSGTGEFDIQGAIPGNDVPRSVNPPNHVIATGNQRPVLPDYPYYVGTAEDFDYGYRSAREYQFLESKDKITVDDFKTLQNDVTDLLAERLMPALLKTLSTANLNDEEKAVYQQLQTWNDQATADSVPATVWNTFWGQYIHDTFDPWWNYYKVPADKYKNLAVTVRTIPLVQNLETWTLTDPNNPFFSDPSKQEKRDAAAVMTQAFHETVASLQKTKGNDITKWRWDQTHEREINSLVGISALGYGPKGSGGDTYTVNVAGENPSTHGPSWRMITDFGTGTTIGIYPGGQSENPLSPWYEDRIDSWWNGQYKPLLSFDQVQAQNGTVTWTLQPAKLEPAK